MATQEKDAEQKDTKATKDSKEDKGGVDVSKSEYGELDARWQVVRSAETFYVLPFDAVPAVEADEEAGIEAQEAQDAKYILRNTRDDTERELTAEEYDELNLQPLSPNKQV